MDTAARLCRVPGGPRVAVPRRPRAAEPARRRRGVQPRARLQHQDRERSRRWRVWPRRPTLRPDTWESSGVVNASRILGPGWWLTDVQAHSTTAAQPGPTLEPNTGTGEDGQLQAVYLPQTVAAKKGKGHGHGRHGKPSWSRVSPLTAAVKGANSWVGRFSLRDGKGNRPTHIGRACSAQWGMVTRAQLAELGFRDRGIAEWVRTGRLHRLYRGVYAVGHDRLRLEGRWLAAVLRAGQGRCCPTVMPLFYGTCVRAIRRIST